MLVVIDTTELELDRLYDAFNADPEMVIRAMVNNSVFGDDSYLDLMLDDCDLENGAIEVLDSWMCEYGPKLDEQFDWIDARNRWVSRVQVGRYSAAILLETDRDVEE